MTGVVLAALLILGPLGSQNPIDPALKDAVERFFATQVNEDVAGYLALWSRTAQRPQEQQLRYIFDSGDDKFIDLEIDRAVISGTTARLRVSTTRVRTNPSLTNPDGSPRMFSTRLQLSLVYVQEDGGWKLLREGTPQDELAAALIGVDDPRARAELLKSESDLVNSRLVDALGRRADALTQMNRYNEALPIYTRALEVARAAADGKGEGQMLQNIANSHYFLRDFPAALENYDRRLTLEREATNDEGIASALIGIATIRYSTYEYTPALALYREALAIQERLNDEALVATTLISTGNVLYLQGDFEAAIADYRRAETLKRKYHDFGGAATALEGLGRTYAAQGDYAAALLAFTAVEQDSRKRRDVPRLSSALHNLGDTHFKLANLDSARVAYHESREHYEETGDLANAGRVLQGTAVTELLSARPQQGEAAYGKSIVACSAAKPRPDSECIARALVGLAFAQAAQEQYDKAIPSYRKSIEAFQALKAVEAVGRAQVGLAEAFSGKQEYLAALKEAENARHIAIALSSDDLLWRALVAQARAERRLGRRDAALGAARAAIAAVQAMADAALQRPAHAVPRDTTIAFVTAAVLQAEAGDAEAAWATIERMRAHALRAALAVNERDIAPGMTDEERNAERLGAAELTALLVQRDREKNLPKPDNTRMARLEKTIREATEKRNLAQAALFKRLPALRTWRGLDPSASVEEIRSLVETGTYVLQLVVDDRDLVALTAQREGETVSLGVHIAAVKRQELAEKVARATDPAALADSETWRRAAADIVKVLPSTALDRASSSRTIVIVPDDVLWRVPFEALPVAAGHLGDSANVVYAASITGRRRRTDTTSAVPRLHVVAAGAPDLSASVVETLKTTAPSWLLRAPAAAEEELSRIQAVLPKDATTILMKGEATEDSVRAGATRASVLHVAAPFRLNAASPLFSSILLAPASMAEFGSSDGVLEAREITTGQLTTRVALFSDPAALSMRDAAASAPTLHWMWRGGGTDTVMLRRWASDEAASAEMLATFYAKLQSASAAEALREARAVARRALAPPQVWAGWLLLGGN